MNPPIPTVLSRMLIPDLAFTNALIALITRLLIQSVFPARRTPAYARLAWWARRNEKACHSIRNVLLVNDQHVHDHEGTSNLTERAWNILVSIAPGQGSRLLCDGSTSSLYTPS